MTMNGNSVYSRAVIAQAPSIRIGEPHDAVADIEKFLFRFGYVTEVKCATILDARMVDAIGQFQEFYAIDTSGEFDEATRRAILMPRCGLPDTGRSRFSVAGPWTRRNISFAFGTPTAQAVGQAASETAVRSAFATWAASGVGLRFNEVRTTQNPDIQIEWRPNNDPDHDMRGGILAHADFPPGFWIIVNRLPLPVHFDDIEHTWAVGRQFDIETVALHEIGHCIGLYHEPRATASVMEPAYAGIRRTLTADDINGVKALYQASVQILNRQSGKTLDVARQDITNNGANVQQWEYAGSPNQQWTLERTSVTDTFWIRCVESGKALDVRRQDIGNNGANVQQWDYRQTPNQHWRLEPVGNGFYWFKNQESGKALDVRSQDISNNGANVQQWDYLANSNQQWRLV